MKRKISKTLRRLLGLPQANWWDVFEEDNAPVPVIEGPALAAILKRRCGAGA
jgi:hypothetical protein